MTRPHETIGAVDDLLSVAEAMTRQSADRYRGLAARLRTQRNAALSGEFETLAAFEDRHARVIADRARATLGRLPEPIPAWSPTMPAFDDDEIHAAEAGPYQALAFAVRNEDRAFAFFVYVAAAADDPAVRALAEDLARDELVHASRLRALRRRAFHQDRPAKLEIPTNLEQLRRLVREWEASAAGAHAALADRLEQAGQRDRSDIFRHLAKEETAAAGSARAESPAPLADSNDGLRLLEANFDRLASIGERAKDERVVAEVQRLAEAMIARVALAAGALAVAPAGEQTR